MKLQYVFGNPVGRRRRSKNPKGKGGRGDANTTGGVGSRLGGAGTGGAATSTGGASTGGATTGNSISLPKVTKIPKGGINIYAGVTGGSASSGRVGTSSGSGPGGGAQGRIKKKKHNNSVHTRPKRSKIDVSAEENSVAKRKRKHKARMKKGSKEAKAWGRKMKRLRSGEANPKKRRKKRRNPYYQFSGEIPVQPKMRSLKGRSAKFKSEAKMQQEAHQEAIANELLDKMINEHLLVPKEKRDLERQIGLLRGDLSGMKHLVKELRTFGPRLKRDQLAAERARKQAEKIQQLGGKAELMGQENPRKRRRKHKKAKKARRHRRKKVVAANPRRKRRRHKKHAAANPRRKRRHHKKHAMANPRHKRRKHAKRRVSYAGHQHSKLRRGSKIRISGMLRGKINPAIEAKHLLWASAGYLASYSLFKIIDGYGVTAYNGANGLLSTTINTMIPASLAPFVAPLIVPGIVIGIAYGLKHIPMIKDNEHVESLAQGAVMVAGVMASLGVATALFTQIKASIPSLAQIPVIGPAFSGITYYPAAMSGADFGMYPQMGEYQQSPGDFGIIPSGMGIMPQGLKGINYTPAPMPGMGAVSYYPNGAAGNAMYPQSAAGQQEESEGLSGADYGILPEGLHGADYGIVPEGMGEDGGQMG